MEDNPVLFLDAHLKGAVITRADSAWVTDSAASATAYACAIKTYNGAIAVDRDTTAVETILEAAERAGFNTGIVSTATITHATPAAFSSHVPLRAMQAEIATQQIRQGIEVIMGGGRMFYMPLEDGEGRKDSLNVLQEAIDMGYHNVNSRDELLAASELPIIGLFTDGHMAYEIDRDKETEPSIAEMTRKALELLSDSGEPFFIMIEAGRIDHAGHANDPAAHLWDTLAYDEAWKVAIDFAMQDGETLVVGTSDHETGGLSLGAPMTGRTGSGYAYDPTQLAGISSSIPKFVSEITARIESGLIVNREWLMGELQSRFQLVPDSVEGAINTIVSDWPVVGDSVTAIRFHRFLSRETSYPARIGWSTGGHTAVDVPIFAYGPGSELIGGVMDNTEVGLALWEALGIR
jgi:alkaline phosphatase